jgi:hypothetical protein
MTLVLVTETVGGWLDGAALCVRIISVFAGMIWLSGTL